METIVKIGKMAEENNSEVVKKANAVLTNKPSQQPQQQQKKRRHRRGKPKSKNTNQPYKNIHWRFQQPRLNICNSNGPSQRGNSGRVNSNRGQNRKFERSNSLAPYNTNKFIMEEHMSEVPNSLLTPNRRTRESSFSVDSEDNYFYSLPEDEEDFLTKEFSNIYEKVRIERLESMTHQQLIQECLQLEDNYSTEQGSQRRQQQNIQRITAEFSSKIRLLEDKVKELTRENYSLRCQMMRYSTAIAAAASASPPSAAAPTGAACGPAPMDSSSEDSESDSSTTSSSSISSVTSDHHNQIRLRPPVSSSNSSLDGFNERRDCNNIANEEALLLESRMDEDSNQLQEQVIVNGFLNDSINAQNARNTVQSTTEAPNSSAELDKNASS